MFVSDHRHGATSVLQSMLGLRFMPGAGSPFEDTVDREELVLNKPLEIEIRPTASNEMQPYVRFPDIDASRRVTDFAEVAARIQTHFVPFPAATAGGQGELFGGDLVEATALRMTLYSPSLPSMTVVQLPGLCQVRHAHRCGCVRACLPPCSPCASRWLVPWCSSQPTTPTAWRHSYGSTLTTRTLSWWPLLPVTAT